MNTPLPHDRDAAVHSVCAASTELGDYELRPLSVQVYEQHVGVVHYSYSAVLTSKAAPSTNVTGKWSEVYLKHHGVWKMIAVSGRPDTPHRDERAGPANGVSTFFALDVVLSALALIVFVEYEGRRLGLRRRVAVLLVPS
jgi:hypothetical protein